MHAVLKTLVNKNQPETREKLHIKQTLLIILRQEVIRFMIYKMLIVFYSPRFDFVRI